MYFLVIASPPKQLVVAQFQTLQVHRSYDEDGTRQHFLCSR